MSAVKGVPVRLSRKARLAFDPVRRQPMLLYPERGLALNPVAHAIVSLCDGSSDRAQIAQRIAERFPEAPPEAVKRDVATFLDELTRRGLLLEAV